MLLPFTARQGAQNTTHAILSTGSMPRIIDPHHYCRHQRAPRTIVVTSLGFQLTLPHV